MDKRLQQIKIVEINNKPAEAPAAVSSPRSKESIDLIAQLHENIQTLEALEFKFSYMLNEVKSIV